MGRKGIPGQGSDQSSVEDLGTGKPTGMARTYNKVENANGAQTFPSRVGDMTNAAGSHEGFATGGNIYLVLGL